MNAIPVIRDQGGGGELVTNSTDINVVQSIDICISTCVLLSYKQTVKMLDPSFAASNFLL